MERIGKVARRAILFFTLVRLATAQAPTGTISGVVRDGSGAPVAGTQVTAMNLATGLARKTTTPEQGDYSFPALLPGDYELTIEVSGFRRMIRQATVEAGVTTAADFALSVGDVRNP